MLRQSGHEKFRDSISSLIEEYREKLSIPHVTDWKEYERKYRSRLTGASRELRSLLLETSSRIREDEFCRSSIIHAVDRAQIIMDDFSESTGIFIILKKNARIGGRKGWRYVIASFMNDSMEFLKEYFKRNNSEAGSHLTSEPQDGGYSRDVMTGLRHQYS